MKDIGESSEVFQAYARIDYCYWGIREIAKGLNQPTTPLSMMIDAATGYGAAKVMESRKAVIELLEELISSKKFIGADYGGDEELLIKLKNYLR